MMIRARQKFYRLGRQLSGAAVVVAVILAGHGKSQGQPDNTIVPRTADVRVVRGNVEGFTKAAGGEIDGAVLDNDSETILHWPIGLGGRLATMLKPGDRVRAIGRPVVTPAGDLVLQVQTVTNLRTRQTVEDPEFVPNPPSAAVLVSPKDTKEGSPRPAASDRAAASSPPSLVTVRGDVETFTKATNGQADGVVLDNEDETVLHWPGRLQDRFVGILKLNDRVRATGRRATSPNGNAVIVVKNLTNLRTKETVENPDFAPSPAPAPATAAPAPAPAASREQRLRRLEEQVELLRREIEQLRKQG